MDFLELQKNWAAPPELRRALPREVRLTAAGKGMVFLVVFLLAGAAALFVFMSGKAARDAERQRLLRESGADAEGYVTRLWRTGGKDDTPMVAYQFPYGGVEYGGESSAPSHIWKELTTRARLAVRFLPSDPGVNQPRDWKPEVLPPWLAPLVAASMSIGPIFIAWALSREKRLLAEGQPVPGVVTRYSNAQHGQKNVHYEFALRKSGAPRRGKSGPARNPPAIGEVVCVLYNPDNPKRNARYPLRLYRV